MKWLEQPGSDVFLPKKTPLENWGSSGSSQRGNYHFKAISQCHLENQHSIPRKNEQMLIREQQSINWVPASN